MSKPFLKWAGGKTQLIPKICERLPKFVIQGQPYLYVEPFLGSAAVGLYLLTHTAPQLSLLNDVNADLINLFEVVKNQPDKLLQQLQIWQQQYDALTSKQDKQPYYYQKRDLFNSRNCDEIEQASLFIFLNKAGFNGLYRVNKNNEFNVPIGSYKRPVFVLQEQILQASSLLDNVLLTNLDYQHAINQVDTLNTTNLPVFIYIDPPYRPLSASASFTAYAKGDFNDESQIQLADLCKKLDTKGYYWMLSNSDPKNSDASDDFFDVLYQDFNIERLQANRSINSNGSKRGKINELLITNY